MSKEPLNWTLLSKFDIGDLVEYKLSTGNIFKGRILGITFHISRDLDVETYYTVLTEFSKSVLSLKEKQLSLVNHEETERAGVPL